MESKVRVDYLSGRFIANQASAAEREELRGLLLLPENREAAKELLQRAYVAASELKDVSPERAKSMLQAILAANAKPAVPVIRLWTPGRWAAAAVAAILLSAGVYFVTSKKAKTEKNIALAVITHDVAPGGNKAVLTLGNGAKVILDSAANGKIAQQGNASIQKLGNGRITYNAETEKTSAILYNTLTTPKGGEYELTLPDGTKVWLNAASSIRYPVAFTGKERLVEMTGEAYFEVVHNQKQPFRVKTKEVIVEDLGTHFDINAYDDEDAVRATLLEGSVKINTAKSDVRLKPGQQAVANGDLRVNSDVDLEQVMAWKNGEFELNGNTIELIMRQVARWYDVEIEYQGPLPTDNYVGTTSRQENLSDLLRILELTGTVRFRIEGKKLIVMKK